MERRDQDTIRNPPLRSAHAMCRPVSQSVCLNTCQPRASIYRRARTEGLFIACVAGVESGRDGRKGKGVRGLGRWGESVRVPFPFPYHAFLAHLLPLLFLCIPRRQACLFSRLSKDSVTLSTLCPSDTTKKQGYFVLTNFYLHNILFQRNTPLLCEMLAFRGFHRDVQRQSIVQRQQQAL